MYSEPLFDNTPKTDLLTIKEASKFATEFMGRNITISNISYLIQYGRVKKITDDSGIVKINKYDLTKYYQSYRDSREIIYKEELGSDLNWTLSFDKYKESETTKHVHRLHPYKGKFIPQLVEYFLDSRTDSFKTESYFESGDIVLDPFSGSGTTMVQANELGLNALGIDISAFNALIANGKVAIYNLIDVEQELNKITTQLNIFLNNSSIIEFENELLKELYEFNSLYFPSPDYKYKLRQKQINETIYGREKEEEFLSIYHKLIDKYKIELQQSSINNFLDKWYLVHIRKEINIALDGIKQITDSNTKQIISLILSRTVRSCRATTHADLATLINPVIAPYYCSKHGKICKPLFSILKWWQTYSKDTLKRLKHFDTLRTNTYQYCLTGDSRTIEILFELQKKKSFLAELIKKQKIKGIFSSPPYVGLIDYHQQHAYAYDLFGFKRNDDLEIGPLFKGQGKAARDSYIDAIADVLNNSKRFFADDYNVFLVANDKYNLYPTIAKKSDMKIVNEFKRPVLNRTEKDRRAYCETIFHLKSKVKI
ncbi:DNA methyltransferase [Helicobacter sp. 13S00477-4]|uniref:DNA methyltransferase n=1 Tax=Helicobacter sp. 13S00477-4 TaxID=1905759 RepID=UPI000BA51A9A|nr:DNA methyltransferase [Helicobacter sp. 13S00477-4]PAF52833.1 restriction endonuclease subunit M [Helicobacter sp. 13S00477-4]